MVNHSPRERMWKSRWPRAENLVWCGFELEFFGDPRNPNTDVVCFYSLYMSMERHSCLVYICWIGFYPLANMFFIFSPCVSMKKQRFYGFAICLSAGLTCTLLVSANLIHLKRRESFSLIIYSYVTFSFIFLLLWKFLVLWIILAALIVVI